MAALAALSSCEKWHWPPYESSARELFDEYRDQFIAIDAAMEDDQLIHFSSPPIGGIRAERASGIKAELSDQQRAKYREIVGEGTIYSFYRHDGVLTIPRSMPSIRGREYLFWYAHDNRPPDDPRCDEEVRQTACGSCVVRLEDDWFLGWAWYPSDEANFDESCAHLMEQELSFE